MDHALSDIRILKLAEMYEHAYEAFVVEMVGRYVRDGGVKARLKELTRADGHAERIVAEMARLNARVAELDVDALERAAIQDVVEIERTAHSFYIRFVEEIHDPRVAALFRELAAEEAKHVRLAEDALALHDRLAGRPRLSPDAERILRLVENAERPAPASGFGVTRRTGP